MNSLIDPGLGGYAVLMAGVLAHEPWRWMGLAIGRRIDPNGEVFRWVRAVSAAMISGLVMRLVLFPTGALAAVGLSARLVALVAGIAIFLALRRNLAAGIAAGTATLALLQAASTL